MTRGFNLWLITFLVQIIIVCAGGYLGLFSLLYNHDVTFLGFTILFSWICLSLSIGYTTYIGQEVSDLQKYFANNFMSIGLAATMIAMLVIFSAFFSLNLQDTESLKKLIVIVATGMVSALGPSLCGLSSSLFANLQIKLVSRK